MDPNNNWVNQLRERRGFNRATVAVANSLLPAGVCRPPGTPWTSRNTSRRRYPRGGTARRCSPRPATPPARYGSFLLPNNAGVFGAECPSILVLPALCPTRISASSSLLTATMNQKSSIREVPQSVSPVLTADTSLGPRYAIFFPNLLINGRHAWNVRSGPETRMLNVPRTIMALALPQHSITA